MYMCRIPHTTRPLSPSLLHRNVITWLALVCSTLLCSVALSAPIQVELEEDGDGLHYRISARDTNGKVKRSDVNLSLTDDKEPLHSIEIQNATAKKKWLKSFTESKSHPYVKGILVRERSGGSVQIRTRFKASPRLPKGYGSMITVDQEGDAVIVTLKNPIKASSSAKSVTSSVPEKPRAESDQEREKLQKVREISAVLQSDPAEGSSVPIAMPTPVKDGSMLSRGAEPTRLPARFDPPKSVTTGSAVHPTPKPTLTTLSPATLTPPPAVNHTLTAPAHTPPPPPEMEHTQVNTSQQGQKSEGQTVTKKAQQSPKEIIGGLEVNLDRQILIVAVLFILALLGLYLMRRSGKSGFGAQGEIPFKIRSRQLVNAQWNQEILIVDVLDRTLLLGSSASGGLSLLAQISPDPHVRPEPQPQYQDYGAYPESDDYPSDRYSRDYQEERYSEEPGFHQGYESSEYYPEQHASPRLDVGHHPQQHEPALDDRDSSYTLEVPMSQMDALPAQVTADLTAERAVPVGGFNASTALGGLEALVSEAQSRSSSSASTSSEPEPSSVSADDLLQKIRQLNQG